MAESQGLDEIMTDAAGGEIDFVTSGFSKIDIDLDRKGDETIDHLGDGSVNLSDPDTGCIFKLRSRDCREALTPLRLVRILASKERDMFDKSVQITGEEWESYLSALKEETRDLPVPDQFAFRNTIARAHKVIQLGIHSGRKTSLSELRQADNASKNTSMALPAASANFLDTVFSDQLRTDEAVTLVKIVRHLSRRKELSGDEQTEILSKHPFLVWNTSYQTR